MVVVGFIAAYRRAYGSSLLVWSKRRQPSGAALHTLRELGELSLRLSHDKP